MRKYMLFGHKSDKGKENDISDMLEKDNTELLFG